MGFKKMGILLTSSALSFGLLSSSAYASTHANVQAEQVQIQIDSTESVFTKTDLINKFHALFPNQFDYLKNSDFQMEGSHFYPDEDEGVLRHALSFSKTIDGKNLQGYIGFIGENLEVDHFYYYPIIDADALFPPMVSKKEAEKIAVNFLKKALGEQGYQLEANEINFYPRQILTEPINYSFSFTRTKNQIAIADQRIEVAVLGNGVISSFMKNTVKEDAFTFDELKQLKSEEEILKLVKDQHTVELQYQINHDFLTGENRVGLVYQPVTIRGIHASSGKWLTDKGYSATIPAANKLEQITANPLPPKQNGITLQEAKAFAEQLLKVESDKVKLIIHGVDDIKNHFGQNVIRINYMYEFANSGTGTTLEINSDTGELIQYQDLKGEVLAQLGETSEKENTISQREALSKAIGYLKDYAPSNLHNYSMPLDEPYVNEMNGNINFIFQRIMNGLPVIGDQIHVGIAVDGSLNTLNTSYSDIKEWPSIDKVIPKEKAITLLNDALSLKMYYMKKDQKEDTLHYDLVYVPAFNEDSLSYLDATTGEWNRLYDNKNTPVVSHPWAEAELNYLINSKILDVKNVKNFNGDASITQGEAITIIMNSLTYFYYGAVYGENENERQTFENIDPKHPLYNVIERAVETGIIKADDKKFNVDSSISREELAVLYIRALGLEEAAKHYNIYNLDFVDANKVKKEYIGYVALADALGLLEANKKNFNPNDNVTYAELASSIIRLAHEISTNSNRMNF